MAHIIDFNTAAPVRVRKSRQQHFFAMPAKAIACPHGCGATFQASWQVDEHLRAKHPGYMAAVASRIVMVNED